MPEYYGYYETHDAVGVEAHRTAKDDSKRRETTGFHKKSKSFTKKMSVRMHKSKLPILFKI